MLQQHPFQTRYRRVGSVLLVLLGLASAGGVHALRAADVSADSLSKASIDLVFDIIVFQVDGNRSTRKQMKTKLRLAPGKEAKFFLGDTPDRPSADPLAIVLKVSELDQDRLQLDTRIVHGEPAQSLGEPRLIVTDGQPGRIEVGDPARLQVTLDITASRVQPAR